MEQILKKVTEKATEFSDDLIYCSTELMIDSTEGLQTAADYTKQAKDEVKTIEAAFKPHKDNAFKSHKDLCRAESDALTPFKKILDILKPKIIKYQNEQDEILRKEKEERERAQREYEAEQKRIAEYEKDMHAENLMDAGDLDKAEAVMEAPVIQPVAAVVPEPEKIKVAGAGTKKVWKARVLNFSQVSDRYKMINQKSIDLIAKVYKDTSPESGLEFYQETQLTGK